jgi:hypothetical protein
MHYAACAWTVAFAAPHIWWALGIPAGFPGGPASHKLLMTTWRWYYDVLVVLLSVVGVIVTLAPIHSWGKAIPRWMVLTLVGIAFVLLTIRGVAGMIVDGISDPVWWPTFLLGGLLYWGVLRSVRRAPW